MTTFERPAPDLHKIADAWQAWTDRDDAEGSDGSGGEVGHGIEVLPGRTMADLKIGGTDKVLETLAAENDAVQPIFDVWMGWEKGHTPPEQALAGLAEHGFDAIVEALDPDQ